MNEDCILYDFIGIDYLFIFQFYFRYRSVNNNNIESIV